MVKSTIEKMIKEFEIGF